MSQQLASERHLRIQSSKGWQSLQLREVWDYRELLWFLTLRDVKGRYRQMALGPLWIVIKPLINMVIFSLIFGGLANLDSEGLPYPIFTYTALLPWTYFATATNGSANSLLGSMNLISKVYFPRLVAPLTAVITGLVDLAVSFLVLMVMMLIYGVWPNLNALLLPLYILFAASLALGVGLWATALGVRFRDLQFVVGYLVQIWMYASPVVYSATEVAGRIPEWAWILYQLNPMFWVVEGFRRGLLGTGASPNPLMLASIGLTLLIMVSGLFVFRRTERTIVDYL